MKKIPTRVAETLINIGGGICTAAILAPFNGASFLEMLAMAAIGIAFFVVASFGDL